MRLAVREVERGARSRDTRPAAGPAQPASASGSGQKRTALHRDHSPVLQRRVEPDVVARGVQQGRWTLSVGPARSPDLALAESERTDCVNGIMPDGMTLAGAETRQ